MMKATACIATLFLGLGVPPLAEEPTQEKDMVWAVSAEARIRPEYRDNLDLESDVDDDTRLGLLRLRIGVDFTWKKEVRIFAQIQDSRTAGEEASTTSNEENLDLHQGYAELTPAEWRGVSLRAGRQEWVYGEERLLGNLNWDNVGRAFDGLRVRWDRGILTLDGLAARISSDTTPVITPEITPPETGSRATTGSDLYGIYSHWKVSDLFEIDGYWIEFADNEIAPGEAAGTSGSTTIDAFGVRAKRTGRFDVVFEGTAERGEASGDDLSAMAAAIPGGWTLGEGVKTRLFAGYDYATGDEDPTDGEREEFFNFFPTNHPHYGYADLFGWRNLESPYLGVSVKRGKHFGLIKGHIFELESEAGAWKSAGGDVLGFDPAGDSGSRVGQEVDLLYRYAWKEKLAVEAGYARFDPGEFAEATRGGDTSHWGYLMLTISL